MLEPTSTRRAIKSGQYESYRSAKPSAFEKVPRLIVRKYAAGELAGGPIGEGRHARALQELSDAALPLGAALAKQPPEEVGVFEYRQRRIQALAQALWHVGDSRAELPAKGRIRHVAAEHQHLPVLHPTRARLDLPTPSGPISPTMQPAGMSRVMASSARVLSYRRLTSTRRAAGVGSELSRTGGGDGRSLWGLTRERSGDSDLDEGSCSARKGEGASLSGVRAIRRWSRAHVRHPRQTGLDVGEVRLSQEVRTGGVEFIRRRGACRHQLFDAVEVPAAGGELGLVHRDDRSRRRLLAPPVA